MRLDRSQLKLHLLWGSPALLATLAAIAWYVWQSHIYGTWIGGGSPAGLVCGVFAGAIILFEMLLWPRKALRRMRLGPVRHWMSAHIWFGLVCVPLAVAHSGFHWGGYLSATLLVLLLVTVLSGIYGLALQNIFPKWMLGNLPAETVYSEIDHVSQINIDDAEQMLVASFGPPHNGGEILETPEAELAAEKLVIVGAIRGRGRFTGREVRTAAMQPNREDAQQFWNAFEELRPFLARGQEAGGPVAEVSVSAKYFDRLRKRCHPESAELVDALEQWCDQRRQFDRQATVHRWLHGWIPFHVAISVALTVLLVVHVFVALRYW